ncbi:aminodeoxychorismate lyase [Parashewanella curva]|uniref:Aminodeoxychorismate lyase n=1 Tax=Parashewanella curva TaxID=2338552 RepID=A0A3L8Q293_9GAMM|nr:aminodeoxychorismate lyase [Parashewanella curva]RLV61119.1 aminodeoxychorismate lyase [Parashewanella curva]
MQKLWINGQRQSDLQGKHCNAFDRGMAYGDGVFATMCIDSHGQIQFLETHIQRLTQAAFRLQIKVDDQFWSPSPLLIEHLKKIALQYPSQGLKLLISRGVGGRGYQAPDSSSVTELVSTFSLPELYINWQKQGIKLQSSEIKLAKQPILAGMKHLNRLEQVMIKSQPLNEGFQDWLVMDTDDMVIESSMANIFFHDGDKWSTPCLSQSGVSGVMREQVIQQLLESGEHVEVLSIPKEKIKLMQHAFITNSLMGVVDIVQVDDMTLAKSPITEMLRSQLGVSL